MTSAAIAGVTALAVMTPAAYLFKLTIVATAFPWPVPATKTACGTRAQHATPS